MADDKYLTFRREQFYDLLESGKVVSRFSIEQLEIKDAVVIRRQDMFASPALATYAAMIAIVAAREGDPEVKAQLLDIADYFQRQGELAAAEGYKLPD